LLKARSRSRSRPTTSPEQKPTRTSPTSCRRPGARAGSFHRRQLEPVDSQIVIRANRDTVYSAAVFDLDAGPVTVTLPDAGKRFRSMIVIDEDQYTPAVVYEAGRYTYTKAQIGTRYLMLALRTLVDPTKPDDIERVHALQDATEDRSAGRSRPLRGPELGSGQPQEGARCAAGARLDAARFGPRFRHQGRGRSGAALILSASAWGGNPDKEAKYLNVTPAATTARRSTSWSSPPTCPVDGFWSISLYNARGNFEPNPLNAYTVNNITAKTAADGSVRVQFGGCDGQIPNCLPITEGWNYMVRFYRPRAEILNGSWKFPEATP
jgi:hypothetical protein